MNEQQIIELTQLVKAYLAAYRERMPAATDGKSADLRAGHPVRQEYRAVLTFVQGLEICRQRYNEITSESFVDDLLTEVLKNSDRVETEVQNLAKILNHDLVTHLYIPLDGIAIDAEEYHIGDVKLIQMNESAFEQLIIGRVRAIMLENPYYNDDVKGAYVKRLDAELQPLKGRVCAEISTHLDIPKTFVFARDQAISAVCDFLQFVSSIFLPHDKTLKISWASDAVVAWRWAFAVSDGPARRSNRHAERVSAGHFLEIDQTRLDKLSELGLDRIADIVGRDVPSEYDAMLQRSIRWFAKGEREEHPDDRKLSYVTAIDLFFSQPGKGATERICRGFAFALAANENALPRVARYMFHMFASRSATSHAGELGILEEEDLGSLRWHVQQFILAMVRHSFTSKKDIARWIAAREATLPTAIREALRDATDWKRVEAEHCMLFTANVLSELLNANLYIGPNARIAGALGRTFRNAARAGGTWVTDVCPLAKQMAKSNASMEKKLAGNPRRRDAVIYLNTVVRIFGTLPWVNQAIAESVATPKETAPSFQPDAPAAP